MGRTFVDPKIKQSIYHMKKDGKTMRDIAKDLNITIYCVQTMVSKIRDAESLGPYCLGLYLKGVQMNYCTLAFKSGIDNNDKLFKFLDKNYKYKPYFQGILQ